jgi:pimeloyl-ACP methyl ester carboxylesterase
MGGYVAFECMRQWPQHVRAAAFLDTTAFPDTPERTETRHQVLRLLREGMFPRVLDSFIASVLPPSQDGSDSARLLREMAQALGPQTFAADVEAILRRGSFEDVLSQVRVPARFLVGELDTLTPPAVAHRMALEIPGARVDTIAGSGHMTALEAPEVVAKILGDFFAEAFASPRP